METRRMSAIVAQRNTLNASAQICMSDMSVHSVASVLTAYAAASKFTVRLGTSMRCAQCSVSREEWVYSPVHLSWGRGDEPCEPSSSPDAPQPRCARE